jgi:SAM-dependent methyltransferase
MNVNSPLSTEISNHQAISNWYRERRIGNRLTQQIDEILSSQLEQVFGYHMLVSGGDIGLDFSRLSKTQRVFYLSSKLASHPHTQAVVGSSSEVPFATDSVDALVLCHTLDASAAPHHVLRECQRILVPNGHLFVINFNPMSPWGLGNLTRRMLRWRAGRMRAVSSKRLRDWLSLLGFSYADPEYLSTAAPPGSGKMSRLLDGFDRWLTKHNAPTGCAYLIHARKRIADHLHVASQNVERPRLIAIPLGKTHEGLPVPRQGGALISDSLDGT